MADRSLHYRTHRVSFLLSDDEYQRLKTLCQALELPTREVLMVGVRRCERRLAKEQRRQRSNGHH